MLTTQIARSRRAALYGNKREPEYGRMHKFDHIDCFRIYMYWDKWLSPFMGRVDPTNSLHLSKNVVHFDQLVSNHNNYNN